MKLDEVGAVGIVTKQNATKDVPVGGEYMNVKKLGLGSGKPKLHDKKATKNTTPNKLFNLGISEDADVLYHATYEPFLNSILANGLGGAGAQQQWEDSKPGYVYLARDPEVAQSHAEANEQVPDDYIDNIVVLAVDSNKLDMDNLEDDPNVLDDDSTLAYKGVIPSNAFTISEGKRVPRKKGQPAGSKKHSDLYTDENPKGTIHGLKFATVKDAKASVNKIKRSGKKHAHKIQAAIAMEQRAKAAGKVSAAAVYRKYINAMKKKTKKMNELRIERPDPKDTLGVKRKDMPQIKSEDYNLFYAYLKKNGAKFTKDTMPASELRAMQKEFSDEGIMKQMRKNIKQGPNTKAVIVSSDGYIMDGHHRWLVALNTGSDLNVMRVNMPAFKLYDLVNKFEKTYYKDMYDSVEMGETRGSIGVPLASGLVVSVFPHRPLRIKKSTPGKLRYDETLDEDIADWFADKWQNIFEKWSAKYKKSINCNNPKGFSQRAHCAGRKKKKKSESIRESMDAELMKLYTKAMKTMPGSPAQKKIIDQINKRRKELGTKEETSESIRESYEIEFVCVNPNFCDATEQKNQDKLFQALRAVPGIIVYKQDFDEHNSMAAIVKDEEDTDAPALIKKLAQQNKVGIDLENDVSQGMMDDIITGRLEGLTDYYDTDLRKNETKEAPPGTYFTKSGNLVKGRLTKDARERGARQTDPKDATRNRVPPVTQYNESFVLPQFDVEWDEAARYPEFVAIGKDAWIKLAKTGKAVTITDASDIENTDAADPDSFKSLDPNKQKRALAQLEKGSVEMPIVAVYSDGFKELIAGNTRLTAMMAKDGRATVWQFEVPDEVATLAEARGTCWRGYQQKGFKKKGNRMVPNCVKEEETDSLGSQINFPGYEKKDKPKKPKKKQKPKSMYDKIVGTFTSAFNLDEGINDPHIFKAVFMAGGPGSGKGFVAQNLLGGTGLRTVNSDDMYELLLKKQDLALDPDTIASPQGQEIRQRAKTLIKSREAQYIDGRIGLVIDGTGKDPNVISKHVNKLREVGYDVAMIFVNTSLEVAQQRNQKRERTLQRDFVTKLWNEVQENIMKFQQIFRPDRFFVIDNSGGLEDLDRKENFDKVYNETQRFLNTPPRKKAALAWIQQQKEQNDAERSAKQQQNKEPDGGTTNSN